MMNFLKDWIIQYQNKFSVGGVETTIDRITGTVLQEGDTISAAYLNEIQKNCIYQVNATRVIEGVLEIYDISIDGSEEFTPFNQTFLIDFSATNTQVDSLLRFNGITYSLRFSDSITNGDIAPKLGFIPKRAFVKLDVTNSKAVIVDFNPNNFVSPALAGTPTAPTAPAGTNTTQIATTAFVDNAVGGIGVANSSLVKTALNASGNAPIYACRAWVNFKGTGAVAIRASGNVSSITDNGLGDYTINFTTAMSDANYVLCANCKTVRTDGQVVGFHYSVPPSTSSVRINIDAAVSGFRSSERVSLSIFR